MLNYVVKLMEHGEYQTCLRHAERLLLTGGLSLAELAQLNMVICRCRIGLGDSYSAVPPGVLAAKLAREIGEWDLLGRTLLNLGTALIRVRQYDQALIHLYSYFEHLHDYATAGRFEGAIWKHIGIAHQRRLETDRAIDALERARNWFAHQGMDASAFACSHDLISTYLQQHDVGELPSLRPVKELLKFQRDICQRNVDQPGFRATYLYDRAAYVLAAGRIQLAIASAEEAAAAAAGDHELAFFCNMLLHRAWLLQEDDKQALWYAVVARMEALKARHYELEFLASEALLSVVRRSGSSVVEELAREYKDLGIDLNRYLPAYLLHHNGT